MLTQARVGRSGMGAIDRGGGRYEPQRRTAVVSARNEGISGATKARLRSACKKPLGKKTRVVDIRRSGPVTGTIASKRLIGTRLNAPMSKSSIAAILNADKEEVHGSNTIRH